MKNADNFKEDPIWEAVDRCTKWKSFMEIQVRGRGKVKSGVKGRRCVFENQAGEHSKLNRYFEGRY